MVELRRAFGLRVAAGCAFGGGEVAASSFFLADDALFGCCLAAETDDGVVVDAVGLGEVKASGVVDVALGVFLGCAGGQPSLPPQSGTPPTRRKPLGRFSSASATGCCCAGGAGARPRCRSSALGRTGPLTVRDGASAGPRWRRCCARSSSRRKAGAAFQLKRAAGDADRGGRLFLGHSPTEQPRRPLLHACPLLPAAALVGELLLRPLAQALVPETSEPALFGGGLLSGRFAEPTPLCGR